MSIMKKIKSFLIIIGLLLIGGITIFALNVNWTAESSPPTTYTIRVELPECQDIYCLDGCTTIDVVIWYIDNGTPRELGRKDYDGSCTYNFENIDVPYNTTIYGNLDNQSSCGVTCSNGQCTTPSTTISLYPDCL